MTLPKFSLQIIAYLGPLHTTNNLSIQQASELINAHTEIYSWRKDDSVQWMQKAKVGEEFRTYTDHMESDQADVFLLRHS